MILSNKLIKVLTLMRDNEISEAILKSEKETPYNYLDLDSNENDVISFVSSSKIEDVVSKLESVFEVTYNRKFLSHKDKNKTVFEKLGYKPEGDRPKRPDVGTKGSVLREFKTNKGNNYCLFRYDNIEIPINKSYLKESTDLSFFWKKNRNKIKVGRLVRTLSTHLNFTITDKLIEEFVNQFKMTYDIEKDALKKFDLMSGVNIAKWYNKDNYIAGCSGQLGNSCMRYVPKRYFNIYKDNDVKLLILYSDKGKITEKGDYKSSKIKGRALVWEGCDIDNVKITFLDRIYTHNDSDIKLFKQYARSKGWYWRSGDAFTNGRVTIRSNSLKYKLKKTTFRNYPYVDTLSYLDKIDKYACLRPDTNNGNKWIALRRADGYYSRI